MTMLRNFLTLLLLFTFAAQSQSHAASVGVNVALGVPYLTQAGLNVMLSDNLSVAAGYNLLDVTVGEANIELSMPELLINFHPFSGAYFIGAGIGSEKLTATAIETIGTDKVSIEVTAMTTIIKTGWMWGAADGGFWGGIDASYIMPSGDETTITAPGVPTTDQAYIDAVKAAKDFGQTAYPNITFARIGWLF